MTPLPGGVAVDPAVSVTDSNGVLDANGLGITPVAAKVPPTPRPRTLTTVNPVSPMKTGLFLIKPFHLAAALSESLVLMSLFPMR